MEKITLCIICLLITILIPITVNAATIDVNLKTEKENYIVNNSGDNILVLTLGLGNFINISEEMPLRIHSKY